MIDPFLSLPGPYPGGTYPGALLAVGALVYAGERAPLVLLVGAAAGAFIGSGIWQTARNETHRGLARNAAANI